MNLHNLSFLPPQTEAAANLSFILNFHAVKPISPSDTPRSPTYVTVTHIDNLQFPQVFDTVQRAVAAGQEVV